MNSLNNITFEQCGYSNYWHNQYQKLAPDLIKARVIEAMKFSFKVIINEDIPIIKTVTVSGNLQKKLLKGEDVIAVGDFVGCNCINGDYTIRLVLPRVSLLARKAPGNNSEGSKGTQVIASNIDYVVVVMSLTEDYNLARMVRYITLISGSGATPVVILTKLDLVQNGDDLLEKAKRASPAVQIFAVNSINKIGIEAIIKFFKSGETVVFVGSSGAGKSTLLNAILGEEIQKTGEVKQYDGRGKHTTTSRELYISKSGTLIIDTPGMREIQLLKNNSDLKQSFEDIYTIARECKYRNCAHLSEPECAVKAALANGSLSQFRFIQWQKLSKETKQHK